MGRLGELGNIGEQRTPAQKPFDQPFQPHKNMDTISDNRRSTLYQGGANRQFTPNELIKPPNESGYTRADRHDLSILANDRERTIALSEDIYALRSTLHTDPDQSWKNAAASFPSHPSVDTSIGRKFLEEQFVRFVSGRQALRYWLGKYKGSKENTKLEITDHLQIPEGLDIMDITFRHNSCALFMKPSDITTYVRYLDRGAGIDISDQHDAGAFTDADLYLEDTKGNRCPVIIVPYYTDKTHQAWVDETILHEEEHTIFRYYEHESLKPRTPVINKRALFTQKALTSLEDVDMTNQTNVEHVLIRMTRKTLSDYRLLFYNEMVASGASSVIDTAKYEGVARDFDPVSFDDLGNMYMYQYARSMMHEVDGLLDSLRSASLSDQQRLHIWWNVERKVAQFTIQNYTIGKWLRKLWETGNENSERYVSKMYAVSITKPWNIGWFIGEDPRRLRQDLLKEPDTARIIRRMMARNMQTIDADTIQPQKQAYIQHITEVIQGRFNAAQTLTDEAWEGAARELFLSCYLPTYLQMAQSIYSAQEELIRRVNTAGIANIDTYDAAVFTKEYLDYFFSKSTLFAIIDNYFSTSGRKDLQKAFQSKWWQVTSIKTDSGDTIEQVAAKEIRAMWDKAGYEKIPIF